MCVFPTVQGKGWQSDPGRQGEVLEGSAPAHPRGRPPPHQRSEGARGLPAPNPAWSLTLSVASCPPLSRAGVVRSFCLTVCGSSPSPCAL